MTYKYNPLLRGGFDESKRNLNDLEDVSTAGTVDGYALVWEETSGTWKPSAAGVGDMLKSDYDQLGDGVVDNSERLEGETLGSVQAHTVDAINILGTLTDANIPDVETLSYGFTFADAQIPTLDASKIISGTFDATQIPDLPTSRIATGTFIADRIPTIENLKGTVPDSKIPDIEGLSYGAAFAEAQIPNLPTTKITSGTFNANRIPTLPNLKGTLTDAKIPDLDTLSYSAAFAEAQIPNLAASKITTGTFNVNRIDTLDNLKGTVTAAKVAALDVDKITTGTFGLARVPTMDDAHIPDLETLSYGAAFGTAQIPSLGAYKIASGTLNADRIPALPTTRITSGTFDDERIPDTGIAAINYVIDGGGAAIGTGIKGDLEIPFACHVDRWTLLADQHGSIVVDIWRNSYVNFPSTDTDSMSGTTNMPAISGTIAAQGTYLSGWGTQGITAGNILRYNVDSCTSIERCTLALKVTKT